MAHTGTNCALWSWGLGAVLCLAACSNADPTDESPSVPPATESAKSAPPKAEESAAPDAESSVSGADLCEYLAGQLPQLREIGSEVGAMANVTVNLYSWYEGQGAVPDGTEIDTLTQEECPEVGSEVLTLAGMDSFATL
ncbi:hypothetical protein [Cellulomonas sp.]|uniref:hypothetical protein n=1 Tax=Cellulomonas sp. TaxID=40001 RepID=UPI003BABB3DF